MDAALVKQEEYTHGQPTFTDNCHIQAVILAAGRGSRLITETSVTPKCLLEVGGKSLIQHQIDMLKSNGVDQILVVVGYQASMIEATVGGQVTCIHSDLWHETEGLYSLSLCKPYVDGDMIVMNCDIFSHPGLYQRLLDVPGNAFAYDSITGTDEEHMKVKLGDGKLISMSKEMQTSMSSGENVGLLYFDAATTRSLFKEIDAVIDEGGQGLRLSAGVDRVAEYAPLYAVDIADLPWIEIDYPEDLLQARQLIFPRLAL